jgi:hypothetical protein
MRKIIIATASFLIASPPAAMGKEVLSKSDMGVEIVTVTERDLTMSDAPTRVLKMVDSSEYNAVIRLVKTRGRATGKDNDRAFDFADSLRFNHEVIVTFKPDDVSWADSTRARPMQIDVFVSGPASFTYALSETGRLVFDCRCADTTPVALRTKYDEIIISAVDSMVSLGKKK